MHFETPRPRNNEERVLPLINVVFLLLIFFMIAGRLAASDPFQVEPPDSSRDGHASIEGLVVLVGPEGQLALDGAVVERAELRAALSKRLDGGAAPPVGVKADARAQATQVVRVLELLREAGVERLELLTVPGGR